MKIKSLNHNYDVVFGMGVAGNVMASWLAKQNQATFISMSDEFPDVYDMVKWREEEKKSVSNADFIIVPDETRMAELVREIPSAQNIPWATLPNGPLVNDLKEIPIIDWHKRLGIPLNQKPFLFTGDSSKYYRLYDILLTLPDWPEEAVILLNCKKSHVLPLVSHLLLDKKVYWNEDILPDPEFYSLLHFCKASFGLYRTDLFKMEFVGKSSGKIMRSIACSRPVIAPRADSFQFIEEKHLGVLIEHPMEIPGAVREILESNLFESSCKNEFSSSLSYDKYWVSFTNVLKEIQ